VRSTQDDEALKLARECCFIALTDFGHRLSSGLNFFFKRFILGTTPTESDAGDNEENSRQQIESEEQEEQEEQDAQMEQEAQEEATSNVGEEDGRYV
jgi:hypothetical protein